MLDISRNIIEDEGGVMLANSVAKTGRPAKMDISWNCLTETTGKALELALLHLRREIQINCEHNKIGAELYRKIVKYCDSVRLTRIMNSLKLKKGREEVKRREEEVSRLSSSLGSYSDVVKETSEAEKKAQEFQSIYEGEYAIYDLVAGKQETQLERLAKQLAALNYRRKSVEDELAGISRKRIQVNSQFALGTSALFKKSKHLKDYLERIQLEADQTKAKSASKKIAYEKEIKDLLEKLDRAKAATYVPLLTVILEVELK